MDPNGSTKRKFSDIWGQLAVSASVLLVPPLLMAAGIMYHVAPLPQSVPQVAAAGGVDAADKADAFVRPDVGQTANFAPASIEQHPVVTDAHPLIEQPTESAQTGASLRTQTTDDRPGTASERSPAATPKVARNDTRSGLVPKRQRTQSLSDILPFWRSSSR
jgi:hypothetical protein